MENRLCLILSRILFAGRYESSARLTAAASNVEVHCVILSPPYVCSGAVPEQQSSCDELLQRSDETITRCEVSPSPAVLKSLHFQSWGKIRRKKTHSRVQSRAKL
jgi:hypothetical protein